MAYYQFLYDNFDDNSIDGAKWAFGSGGITESSGRMNAPAGAAGNQSNIYGERRFDIRKGILAVRLYKSGTNVTNVWSMLGLWDPAGLVYANFSESNTASMYTAINTVGASTRTNVDTTVGMGPSFTAGTWVGFTYTPVDKTLRLWKSTTPTGSWTEIAREVFTATPTFDFSRVGLILGAKNFSASSSTFVANWEESSYFALDTALKVRVRYNGAWVYASPKVMIGGAWKRAVPKIRVNGNWSRPS